MVLMIDGVPISSREELVAYIEETNGEIMAYNRGKPEEEQKALLRLDEELKKYEEKCRKREIRRFRQAHHCYDCERYRHKGVCLAMDSCIYDMAGIRPADRKMECPKDDTGHCPYANDSGTCFGFCIRQALKEVKEMKAMRSNRRKGEMGKLEVIAIDHGWSSCKTPNDIYTSGVREITTEPAYFDNILEYQGKYYKVGTDRLEVKANKVETPDYYYLTLAGIGKELKRRGKTEARILLAAGLPASRYGDEKQDFIQYLKQNEEVRFSFEQEQFHVWIERVLVYPQCYAAVVKQIGTFGAKVVVVDIGSWTIDIIPVVNKKPDDAGTNSIPHGLITCMRNINKECVRQLGEKIDEELIQEYMITGKTTLPKEYIGIMDKELKAFVSMVYNLLREEQYSLKTTPFVFVGGGAVVMKRYGECNQINIKYNLDVKANAIGYETLANFTLKKEADKYAS